MRESTLAIIDAMHRAVNDIITDEWLDSLLSNIQYDFETGYEYDRLGIEDAAQDFLAEEDTLHDMLVRAIADEIVIVSTVKWAQ